MNRQVRMKWLVKRPVAHRGLHNAGNGTPENSAAAFEEAIRHNYIIELDLRLSADRRVVVFHDEDLVRMTGRDGLVARKSWDELRQMRLLESRERMLLFEEALEIIGGKVPLLVEIKNTQRQVGRLEGRVWRILRDYQGEYAMQSFNPYTLRWYRKNADRVIRGQLSGNFRDVKLARHRKVILKYFGMNYISRPDFINFDIQCLPNKIVNRQRRKGRPVLGWTARSKGEYRQALRYCDNVVFEHFLP